MPTQVEAIAKRLQLIESTPTSRPRFGSPTTWSASTSTSRNATSPCTTPRMPIDGISRPSATPGWSVRTAKAVSPRRRPLASTSCATTVSTFDHCALPIQTFSPETRQRPSGCATACAAMALKCVPAPGSVCA